MNEEKWEALIVLILYLLLYILVTPAKAETCNVHCTVSEYAQVEFKQDIIIEKEIK